MVVVQEDRERLADIALARALAFLDRRLEDQALHVLPERVPLLDHGLAEDIGKVRGLVVIGGVRHGVKATRFQTTGSAGYQATRIVPIMPAC
jgi:hypothetical protein